MLNQGSSIGPGEPYRILRALPPFPPIAAQLVRVLADEDCQTQKIVDLIRADPMFTAELLRTANSAKYGRAKAVSSISHAVAILGRDTLRSFGVALTLRMYIGKALQYQMLARVWRHSVASAIVADLLERAAEGFRLLQAHDETAYVAGLLHEVGALAMMTADPAKYAATLTVATNEKRDLREVERSFFDMDHCQAGKWIALQWKFSQHIAALAFGHHMPPSQIEFRLPDLVKMADLMVDALGYDMVPTDPEISFDEVRARLPITVQKKFAFTGDELRQHIENRIGELLGDSAPEHAASPVPVQ